jgi:hypothetical protein
MLSSRNSIAVNNFGYFYLNNKAHHIFKIAVIKSNLDGNRVTLFSYSVMELLHRLVASIGVTVGHMASFVFRYDLQICHNTIPLHYHRRIEHSKILEKTVHLTLSSLKYSKLFLVRKKLNHTRTNSSYGVIYYSEDRTDSEDYYCI